MTAVTDAVPRGSRILLDTSVLIAHLDGSGPVASVATELVEGCLLTGRNEGVISTISVAELLARPLRGGQQAADPVIAFLRSFPDLLIRSVDFLVASEAARIRAVTGLALPDAAILATAILTTSQVLATNDRALADAGGSVTPGLDVLLLADRAG